MKNNILKTAALALVLGAGAPPASGQEGVSRLTPAVALARLCISEASWDCFESGDGVAIHEVISRGAARSSTGSYTSFARAYAGRLFGARPHDVPRLRWVGQLTEACTEPAAWPETALTRSHGIVSVHPHPAWSHFRSRCLAVMARAAEVVVEMPLEAVDEWSICERSVHDWGGAVDAARALRIGLVPVDCGITDEGTRNTFYCRPGVDPTCVMVDRD